MVLSTLKHFVPERLHPTSQVEVVAMHAVGLAVAQVRGAQVKKEKKPQDTVQVAEPGGGRWKIFKREENIFKNNHL